MLVAYGAFLGLLKIWLIYFAICIRHAHGGSSSSGGTRPRLLLRLQRRRTSADLVVDSDLGSGGGKFGGGGASGSWGTAEPQPVIAVERSVKSALRRLELRLGLRSRSRRRRDRPRADLIAVAAAIIGAGAYLIWAAPTILGDTAFNAVLATALIHKTKKVSHPDWVGSVVHATAIPFSLVFALTILMGWYAQHICPSAMRVRDAIHCASR